jgi:hypothetical protein
MMPDLQETREYLDGACRAIRSFFDAGRSAVAEFVDKVESIPGVDRHGNDGSEVFSPIENPEAPTCAEFPAQCGREFAGMKATVLSGTARKLLRGLAALAFSSSRAAPCSAKRQLEVRRRAWRASTR